MEIITLNKNNITDFAEARNQLLKKAKSEWIFFVDSDEIATKSLRDEVLERIKDRTFNGFYVKRKNYFLGKYIGTDRILRVGRKGAGKWFRRVHEVWHISGNVGELETPLIHNTAKSLYEYIEKVNFYSDLHAIANKEEGKRSNIGKIIFYPIFKFIQSILIGRGFVMSMLQSFHSFLSWSKEWKLQNA